jgi:hypothetical protein
MYPFQSLFGMNVSQLLRQNVYVWRPEGRSLTADRPLRNRVDEEVGESPRDKQAELVPSQSVVSGVTRSMLSLRR